MFSTMDANLEPHLSSCICGHHVYIAIWSTTVREELQFAKRNWEYEGQICNLHLTYHIQM